ncbi:hypothetical protein BDZ97DRAFT_1620549, partial [Flammula alnicola]
GGISEQKISQRLFQTEVLSGLTSLQREAIRLEQIQTHRWRNEHNLKRVVAIGERSCLGQVSLPVGNNPEDGIPLCSSCKQLLSLRAFVTAIHCEVPQDKDRIFVPHQYQNAALGQMYAKNKGLAQLFEDSDKDIFHRFARQFLAGSYDDKPVFLGLVEVMTEKVNREAHNHGMQNMHYPPAFNDWL